MMASSQSHSIKTLNKSPGRRRFVFKNFAQRVEEIDIDVYRSLDTLKPEPTNGSSFFLESLLEWRELNTAEDFISFYEEMMPWVQTLPQILLYKETIISKLLCRLTMQAKLSLEPILRLIAVLSRDLLEEFLPFLQKLTDSLVDLLKSGGEREPEILEQVFTSLSYIMLYLQRYLVRDVVHVLKITIHLRYYPKDYVQEFMAEAVSFLLRNAPTEQLIKGIRKVVIEVLKNPSLTRKAGVGALIWHVTRGTSSRLHSKALDVLRLLMDNSIMRLGDKFTPGSDTVVEVVCGAFGRLLEELDPKELNLVLDLLYEEISDSISDGCLLHLSRLLSLLIFIVQFRRGGKICGCTLMLELVERLIHTFIIGSVHVNEEGHCCEVINKTLQLMLYLLDDPSNVSDILLKSGPVFDLRNSSLLTFMKGLLEKDPTISYAFRIHIVSAMNDFIEDLPEEVLYMMLTLFERLKGKLQSPYGFDEVPEDKLSRIRSFIQEKILFWTRMISDIANDCNHPSRQLDESELAVLWGILNCYPYVCNLLEGLKNFVNALDRLLAIEADKIAGIERLTWQSLVGAALASYHKLLLDCESGLSETSSFLHFAIRFKSSSQILFSVALFLDSMFGPSDQDDANHKSFHSELQAEKAVDAINVFADNLSLSDKSIRTSTLRILCHYEPLEQHLSTNDHNVLMKLKMDESQQCYKDGHCFNVIKLLLLIEATPISISTSRKVTILISRIQMSLSAGKIPDAYVLLLLNGVVGIFYNRFGQIWEPAIECLGVLLGKHIGLVWDRFVQYLENLQSAVLTSHSQDLNMNCERLNSNGLVDCFNSFKSPDSSSTPCPLVLAMLLQSLQKVPVILESVSRQLMPLFFKFLGYTASDTISVKTFNQKACKGKDWKMILKEWLNLLKLMRNPKSLYQSQVVKEVLINRLLDDIDSDIQLKALDCLLNWKDSFLIPYSQHLKNLIASKSLREELTTWSLSRESDQIQEEHRGYIIPLVIRLLMPKVRKLKALASRKHTGVHHRRAVLSFLAQLDINELRLFFSLLLKSLRPNANGSEYFDNHGCSGESFTDEYQVSNSPSDNIANVSWKTRYGFLHVIEDILRTFDEAHVSPFLNLLMTFIVWILESCTFSLSNAKISGPSLVGNESTHDPTFESSDTVAEMCTSNSNLKQFKDLRSLCLKIISFVLNKYECHDFGSQFWDVFFVSVKPLIDSFKQEGSSSEKPSSLFSCFVAMSRSPRLVSLLDRRENLVPTIFLMLTMKTASDAIISYVLIFIENLLNLDNDIEYQEDCAIKRVLLPHLETLILSLHDLFHRRKVAKRISIMSPGKTELRILKLLAKYIKDPLAAMKFIDIMLPVLAKKAPSSDECLEGMYVIQGVLPVVGGENAAKILKAVHPLLVSAGLEIRLLICDIIDGLALNDTSLASLAKLVRELNAMSVSEVGEIDYDTRVNAYESITPELFSSLKEENALVILSQCLYDMASEEMILRQSASKSLLSFIQFAGSVLEFEAMSSQEMAFHDNGCGEMMPVAVRTQSDFIWTRPRMRFIINKFFLLHMGEAMGKGISAQKEWISLLRAMILNLPGIPSLKSCRPLCSEDVEVDFFNNILHLQKHRRARALSRFKSVANASFGTLSEKITMKVFVPLFFSMLFDVKDGKGEHVRDACLESLASISGCMKWESYHVFLMRCFREMTTKPDKQKILLRLICSVLDKICQSRPVFVIDPEIQASLQKTVLPKFQKLLDSDNEKVIVTISLATLKLLKLLPLDIMESQLPSIIHRICNFLKNRLDSVRDEARFALAACSKELGLEFLHFIIKVLRATLKRGYELHVLGYTLNFILSKTLPNSGVGKLDYCLEELLAITENDILGGVADEKEVDKIASKMKETRKNKSFDTLKLVAQSITFKSHAMKLLSPIKAHLKQHLTPKVKAKLEAILHYMAAGIECNPSVDQTDLFIFVYGLIEDGIAEEKPQVKRSSNVKISEPHSHVMTKDGKPSGSVVGNEIQSSHLVTVFALGILDNRLKNLIFDKKDEKLLSMLDPFVGLLGTCLRSKHENIVSAALKCLAPLLRLPLPSIDVQVENMKFLLLDFVQKSPIASSPMMQSCLKLLTALLRSSRISLSSDQMHMLFQSPLFVDLGNNPSFVALSLLKAIVGQNLVVHEIYDVVSRVAELMVTSQLEPIRKKCSQILLQFLLDYKLSHIRLQQHLDFLLVNISYEHSTGRESVLEMIHAILIKFPQEVVDGHAETFFLHLVVCLANDNDNKVRSMVGAAIKLLIGRTSQHILKPILEYCLSWYMGEKPHLWSPAAQVLGLLAEVLKKGFETHVQKILQVALRIMKCSLDNTTNEELDSSHESTIPLWREAYYSLVMLEKMLHKYPELYLKKDTEEIWENICNFLLHAHMWLRNISNRLLASYFASVSGVTRSSQTEANHEPFLLLKTSRLFAIAVSLCCQLKSHLTDDSSANLITQNLAFTICGIHSFAKQKKCIDPLEFWSNLAMREKDHFAKSFELLGSRKVKIFFQSLTGNGSSGIPSVNDQNGQGSVEDLQSMLVTPLLKRMGKLALQKDEMQMKIVFNCFRVLSSQIGSESCNNYAIHMLQPLYKVCEGFSGKVISDEIKQLAEEVRDSIRGTIGVDNFVQVYNLIRKNLKARRDKRRQEEKLIAVVNPTRHAKRKIRIAAKHRAHKRRKIMTMKMR